MTGKPKKEVSLPLGQYEGLARGEAKAVDEDLAEGAEDLNGLVFSPHGASPGDEEEIAPPPPPVFGEETPEPKKPEQKGNRYEEVGEWTIPDAS